MGRSGGGSMSLFSNPLWPYIVGIVLAVLAGAGWKLRQSGVNSERAKQAQAEAKARDVKDEVRNEVNALPANKARERLGRWSR